MANSNEPPAKVAPFKWLRRRPRWTSATSLGLIAATLVLSLAALFIARGQRLAQLEALGTLHQFRQEMQETQFLLIQPDADRRQQDSGIAQGRVALSRFGVPDNPSWRQTGPIRYLLAREQEQLRQDIGELLFLLARITARQVETTTDPSAREEQLQSAHRLNVLAETCYAIDEAPQAFWLQRADLAHLSGEETVAQCLRDKAQQVPQRGARDLYLSALEHFLKKEFRQGLRLVQQVRREAPQDFWVHWLLASCHAGLRQDAEAVACYTTCIALQSDAPWAYLSRGLVYLEQKDYTEACADFDQVLRQRPELVEAYVQRALARLGLNDLPGALEDLTYALEHGAPFTRIYFLRAQVREQVGDREGARQDRAEGLRREPLAEPGSAKPQMRQP
jgi:tetratricopeptide (TPR) repeat protein